MKKSHHIIDVEGQYLLVETMEYADKVFSRVVGAYNTLDLAEKTRIISTLYEDGVPVNAASSGHVAAIGIGPDGEPPAKIAAQRKKRKKIFQRKGP